MSHHREYANRMQQKQENDMVSVATRKLQSFSQMMSDSDRSMEFIYKNFEKAMTNPSESITSKRQLFLEATKEYEDHIINMNEKKILIKEMVDNQDAFLSQHLHELENGDSASVIAYKTLLQQHEVEKRKLREENERLKAIYEETQDAYTRVIENVRISQPFQSEEDIQMVDKLKEVVAQNDALLDENYKLKSSIQKMVKEKSLLDLQEGKSVLQAVWDMIYYMDLRIDENEEIEGVRSGGNLTIYG